MRKRIGFLVATAVAAVGMTFGPATAFAIPKQNPNAAGGSGHFHPNSNPCDSDNDHPNCPGPH